MDHHQRKSDCQRRKAGRGTAMGRAHDDEEEHHRHHDLHDEAGDKAVLAGRMRAKAVRCKALADVKSRGAARDHIEQRCSNNGTHHLRDDVGQDRASQQD